MDELIYNQNHIPRAELRYGLRSSAATGCGWIATYNALRLMGYRVEKAALVRWYERQVPLIHGNAGTFFFAPALYFRSHGFPAELIMDRRRFDRAAREADVCIVYYHWREKWKLGAHFVAVERKPEGFLGYNTYRSSRGPDPWGSSIDGFLRRRKYFAPVLLAIKKRPLTERTAAEK